MAGLRVSSFFLLLLSGCALADNSSYVSAGQDEFIEHFSSDKTWQEDGLLKLQLKKAPFQPLFNKGCGINVELVFTRAGHTSIFKTRAHSWDELEADQFIFDFKPAGDHSLILTYETVSQSCVKDPQFLRRHTLDFNVSNWLK